MENYLSKHFQWWILGLAILLILFIFLRWFPHNSQEIQNADESYRKGETAATLMERKQAFNHALDLYLSLEQQYQPKFGDGKLYYNIGNTFYQLEDFPRAILYYKRAEALRPTDSRVQQNLLAAQQRLSITPSQKRWISRFNYLSFPQVMLGFFVCALAAFLSYSLYIWKEQEGFKKGAQWLLVPAFAFLSLIVFMRYFSPIEAVLIESSFLRKDAGEQYAKVSEQPLMAGTQVEVLEGKGSPLWYKVISSTGEVGYVSSTSTQLVLID